MDRKIRSISSLLIIIMAFLMATFFVARSSLCRFVKRLRPKSLMQVWLSIDPTPRIHEPFIAKNKPILMMMSVVLVSTR